MEKINTIIIGAGQAGLSTSYYLTKNHIAHRILEEHQVAYNWKKHRWDSFSLVTPNWMNQLPGFPYRGDDPHGFLTKEETIQYMEDYAKSFNPPIVTGQKVLSVKKEHSKGYIIETKNKIYQAQNVVVATGIYHNPKIPPISKKVEPTIFQIHSNDYKNPDVFPQGNVLVVGAGRSGVQIAYELQKSGRKTFLCVGSSGSIPFSYRGYHGTFWLNRLAGYRQGEDVSQGFMGEENRQPKDIKGKMSLGLCQETGVTLLGRLGDIQGNKASIQKGLKDNIKEAVKFQMEFRQAVDEYVAKVGDVKFLSDSQESIPTMDMNSLCERRELDLSKENITSIVWCTGYQYGYNWIDIPTFDDRGYPMEKGGITHSPGLYFIGLHLIPKMRKKINFGVGIYGVGEDAKNISEDIIRRNQS